MTNHGFLFTSRRHFIQTTAAASATALWAGSASAGPASAGYSTSNFLMELGGTTAGMLSSVGIAEHVFAPGGKGGAFGLGPFSASHAISEANTLVSWIMSLARKEVVTQEGAIILADHNLDAKRRVDWTEGLLTSVQFPKLAANESKKPFAVDIKWQPSSVKHSGGSGKIAAAKKGAKAMSTGAFKLKGLPTESDFVTSIALPLISAPEAAGRKGKEKPAIKIGDVTVEFGGRSREGLHKYVQGVIADGKLTDNEYLDLSIDLLDPSLKNTLGTVQLFGCGLRSLKESKLDGNIESMPKFTLTFSVERFDLVF